MIGVIKQLVALVLGLAVAVADIDFIQLTNDSAGVRPETERVPLGPDPEQVVIEIDIPSRIGDRQGEGRAGRIAGQGIVRKIELSLKGLEQAPGEAIPIATRERELLPEALFVVNVVFLVATEESPGRAADRPVPVVEENRGAQAGLVGSVGLFPRDRSHSIGRGFSSRRVQLPGIGLVVHRGSQIRPQGQSAAGNAVPRPCGGGLDQGQGQGWNDESSADKVHKRVRGEDSLIGRS